MPQKYLSNYWQTSKSLPVLLSRPDSKNWQYQETIKKGDLLLNRVQKLSRVINM